MKKQKVMNKLHQLVFIMGFMGALVFLPSAASAQIVKSNNNTGFVSLPAPTPQLIDANSVTWKSSADALPLVEQKLAQLTAQLASLSPNTAAYAETNARRGYYKEVLNQIESGLSVKEAVTTTRPEESRAFAYKSALISIINEATTLLSN